MRSLPFRLLVVNDLDMREGGRHDRHNWHQPGVVEDSEHKPLWRSPPKSLYPLELGLILLSVEPATIKSLRVTVELTRAPARLEILAGRMKNVDVPGHLDAVSRYFSADWTPCSEVLVWDACVATRTDKPREMDSKAVRLDVPGCSFIRLVVHAPHKSARNRSHEVILEDIELLGLTEDTASHARKLDPSSRIIDRQDGFGRIHHPLLLSPGNDSDALQVVLLDAGIPMSLVAQVAAIPDVEAVVSAPSHEGSNSSVAGTGMVVPESISQDNEPTGVPESGSGIIVSQVGRDSSSQDKRPKSPFDRALRQYVEQTACEKAVLEKILGTEICKTTDKVASWQSPTISPTDPANSNEVTLYTFGEFFTQCLLCGGSDIQEMCVQMVERFARLLKDAVGATSAFEGIVALIIMGVRGAKSSRVFRAAIHLAHTVFLTKTTSTMKALLVGLDSGKPLDQNDPAASVSMSSLGLIEEVDTTNLSYGLRIILGSTLASHFCWSVTNHTSKPTSFCLSTSSQSRKVSDRLSKLPPSIDREFLQFILLLIEQDLTCASFFEELLDLTPNVTGTIFTANRLRLLRLVLRDGMIHRQISANVRARIHSLCSSWLTPNRPSPSAPENAMLDDKEVVIRLASECIDEIERSSSNSQQTKDNTNPVKGLLVSVHKHLQSSSIPNSHHSYRHYHTACFVQDPLTESEIAEFAIQMQRYFSVQPRPNALYRHEFVRATRFDSEKGEIVQRELFQKGNIVFQGHVVARTPPKGTFHEEIKRNTAPFVFDVGTPSINKVTATSPLQISPHQEVVSSFAAFRGTIEQRSDLAKRTSKVSPEDHCQGPKATETLAVTSNQLVSADAVSSSADAAAKIPVQKNSIHIAESTLSKEIPTLAPTTATHSVSIPVTVKQTTKYPKQTAIVEQLQRSKVKGKEKRKDKGKSDSKAPDNCVLQ